VFYLFVLGCAVVLTIVVALLRDDVPDARRWTLVLIASVVVGPVASMLSGPLGLPEGIDVLIALVVTPIGFTAGALGAGLVMVRGGRHRDLGVALLISGGSVALLAIYAGFAIVVSTVAGGNPPYQAAVELLVELVVATGIGIGAAGAILAYVQRGTRYPGSLRRLP
jgi:hypothetical protein